MIKKIIKKLQNKDYKDVFLRLKKVNYQRRIKSKNIDFFYSDKYLNQYINFNSINSMLKMIDLSKKSLFIDIQLTAIDEKHKTTIIHQAELISKHSFDLLGSNQTTLDYGLVRTGLEGTVYNYCNNDEVVNTKLLTTEYEPIDWLCDFKSGFRWKKTMFYSKIRNYGNKVGVDIKVPWELSRCQHFGILGSAYKITNNKKYAYEIKNQIIDWINNNLYCHGPNWVCAMDVGIRASNWLVALDLVKDMKIFEDEEFLKLFSLSMLHHQEYILNNLEWTSKLTSNHYLSDVVGLFFISTYFPYFKNSKIVHEKYKKELELEIIKQTYYDGMNAEGSTSYHRLVLELFAYSALLGKRTNNEFSQQFLDRLYKMFQFSKNILDHNGRIPQVGDNDSGVFLQFTKRDLLNHQYLCDIANSIFEEQDFFSHDSIENTLLNKKVLENRKKTINYPFCKAYEESGIYIYKNEDMYMMIYNGKNGQKGNGGHAHNDKLSFTLQYKGIDLFVDPGTYLYTPFPNERNRFRSTLSHNTVMVKNYEQNRFIDNYLFGLVEDARPTVNKWECDKNGFLFKGSHNGYQRIDKELIHFRSISFNMVDKKINIFDSFENDSILKKYTLIINKAYFQKVDDSKILFKFGNIIFEGESYINVSPFFYSKEYGHKNDTSFIRLEVGFYANLKSIISLT